MINICTGYITDIDWQSAKACNFVTHNNVDCWLINISSNLYLLDHFLSVMEPGEIARANRYFQINDKNRFIITRGALRVILSKYLSLPPAAIEFSEGLNKKPYIRDTNDINLHFNISHSGDCILFAIANSEIGADVELIKPAFDYHEVLQDTFSEHEISFINQTDSAERFFMLWTRKEALIKATGKGLDEDLKLIPCLDGTHVSQKYVMPSIKDWVIASFKLNQNYFASIAYHPLVEKLRFWNIDFKDSNILR